MSSSTIDTLERAANTPPADAILTSRHTHSDVISAHMSDVRRTLHELPVQAVHNVVEVLRECRDRGNFIYVAGNGGSASTASHWVNDLGKATKRSGRKPIRAMCLSDNISWFSALSNDEGYDRSLSGQLENFAAPGDVLICISASGNSPNLLHAVTLAHSRGVTCVGLLGFDGGALKAVVDHDIFIASPKGTYELVEDVHMAVCHAITKCLIADRADCGK